MNSSYKVSFYSLLGLLFLLPIFFIPSLSVPLGIAKLVLIGVLTLVAFFAFLIETFRTGGVKLPSAWILWSVIVFPVVYYISSILGSMPSTSLFGYVLEIGTFGYMLITSVILAIASIVFSDKARILKAYSATLLSLTILAVFAFIKILSGGDVLVWNTFAGNIGNPVGSWTDYAMIFGLSAIISMFAILMLELEKKTKIFSYIVFVLSILLVGIINFSTAWLLVLIVSVISLIYFLTVERKISVSPEQHSVHSAPKLLIALFTLAVVFVVSPMISSTSNIGNSLSQAFGISNTEVRPSLSATFDVSKPVLKDNILLGSGPNTFSRDWLLYKPAEINTTTFWNTTFPFGAGFIPTQLASTGVLGTLAWAAFLVLFLLLGVRMIRKNVQSRSDRFLSLTAFMSALFLWLGAFFYVPSVVMLTLAVIFTGIFIASCVATGILPVREFIFSRSALAGFVSTLLMVVMLAGGVFVGFGIFQKTLSLLHFQKALVMSNTEGSSIDDIHAELAKAIAIQDQDVYYRSLAELNFAKAQSVLSNSDLTTDERTKQFQEPMAQSIASAQAAVNKNTDNYENWLLLGSLYQYLVPAPFSINGAYESARATFEEAKKRNPSNPQIPLLLARLELDHGNPSGARIHINEALALKIDYADAYFLLTQIEIAANDLPQAIKSAETGTLLSPGNSGVLFELGLLKYSNKDYAGAIDALQAAIQITPDYANAKYFLGLSLENVGRHDEAIAQFQDLQKTNPDNQEVALILSNLQAGKAPLTGIEPAPTSGERSTPPIEQPTQ